MEEEEGTNSEDSSSDLEGKDKSEYEKEGDTTEKKIEQKNSDHEDNQQVLGGSEKEMDILFEDPTSKTKKEYMVQEANHAMETREQEKDDLVHNENSVDIKEQKKMEREDKNEKDDVNPKENTEDFSDVWQSDRRLPFMNSAKCKADAILQVDLWMYKEIMGLKKRMEIMEHNQEADRKKINNLEMQMRDILIKLKDYENNLTRLIKKSRMKMEEITSSICAAAANLGKRANEKIKSLEGPSKRTRQSLKKKALQDAATSTAISIQDTAVIGKEAVKMILELEE